MAQQKQNTNAVTSVELSQNNQMPKQKHNTISTAVAVPHGYKMTKLGIIPKDWEVKNIKKCLKQSYSGGTPSRKNKEFYNNGTISWIKSGELNQINVNYTKEKITREAINKSSAKIVPPNTLLYAMYGATAGTLGFSRIEAAINQAVLALFTNESLEDEYLFYILNFKKNDIIYKYTQGGQPNLSVSIIKNLKIPLPPLPEQKAIANILSTWDKAISTTTQLIQALQQRKKGLVQQLLSGKKRLAGFSENWKTKKGGELFANYSDKNHDGTLEVLSATQDKGVIPRSETGIDIKYEKSSLKNYKKVEKGDYVISLRSFQGGIEYSNYEGLVSPAYTVLKEKLPISKKFYKEYLKTTDFINRLNAIIYGIRDGKQISYKEFTTLKILYPPLKEQQAIANILTAADKEIKHYQAYLQSLQAQKKGLMQQLLTGKIRCH